jgi:hypothetical protein
VQELAVNVKWADPLGLLYLTSVLVTNLPKNLLSHDESVEQMSNKIN